MKCKQVSWPWCQKVEKNEKFVQNCKNNLILVQVGKKKKTKSKFE